MAVAERAIEGEPGPTGLTPSSYFSLGDPLSDIGTGFPDTKLQTFVRFAKATDSRSYREALELPTRPDRTLACACQGWLP